MFMNNVIQEFISLKNIAIVGFSRYERKFGNYVFKELNKKGYNVFAVNSTEKEINSIQCYSNLMQLKDKVEGVFISVSPSKVPDILYEASAMGIKYIWLQQGAESDEAIHLAEKLGLKLISKKCILMYAQPVKSFHKFHRTINSWLGKL